MPSDLNRSFQTPRREELGLITLTNPGGLSIAALPNGTLFSIDFADEKGGVMINQVLGSPVYGGIGRLYLRVGGAKPATAEIVGPKAAVQFGHGTSGFSWSGETAGIRHTVSLRLHPSQTAWFWQVSLQNTNSSTVSADLVLLQDVGLGDRGFLMNSEAYASQYIDHHIADHATFGPVVLNRQNLKQGGGRNPWVAQGCLEGTAAYATDAIQLVVPSRSGDGIMVPDFGKDLPSTRRQHEVACPAIQSKPLSLAAGDASTTTFFGLFIADHPTASSDADLSHLDALPKLQGELAMDTISAAQSVRSHVQNAPLAESEGLDQAAIDALYPNRLLEEHADGKLLSFFVPDGPHNRHIVLREKEHVVARRHGSIVRSGQNMLLDDKTLAATCWMQGIFAAQLTIGNTSFHKLFSVSRDPYNLTRSSGLRILVDLGDGWCLLGVPAAFEMGLSDIRWIYRLPGRTITVSAIADGKDPAMQWKVSVEGEACRFLIFGHIVLGERDYEAVANISIDQAAKRISFRPQPSWLWDRYPNAAYHLVTSTPDAFEAVGGDELLYEDGNSRNGPFIALKSHATQELRFAVTGSMADTGAGEAFAMRYAAGVESGEMLAPARSFWSHVTRGARVEGDGRDVLAQSVMVPWIAHDAIVHLSVPHGLEQYTGAAWGTRDVCQGPIEFLLAYEHDDEVRQILSTLFSEQYRDRGDWPQWFMLEPYANIRAGEAHGDIVVWPLKALCDYIEATGDITFLAETVPWRADDTMQLTSEQATISDHVEKLLATVRSRFVPGTSLIRYGEGDWNDSLQPADPHLRDWMVSSWTVSLLYEQLVRYANILTLASRTEEAQSLQATAVAMRADFNRLLMRDGIVAGYGVFDPSHDGVELLLHPEDTRTGLHYSLIAMTQPMIGGLFTPDQRHAHMKIIRENLLFPDGVRLMEKPATYSGGPEKLFRRAESSSFFGREIGLMYVHAHLRYCEALALDHDAEAVWQALALANPIAVSGHVEHASLRQRNTYFSSSDAAFDDRYHASSDWSRVKAGDIAVDGGWRTYSSGPGLYTKSLIGNVFGFQRQFGQRIRQPLLPSSIGACDVKLDFKA
ncbi:cellobiose phosphorylase [Rhizobium sp. P38BS-XIX]|uniref:GH36-type glycosyl hydrolase domain-containing protein n=1 Tax=Rhizobium sp. P38BS-XIX TaxID=2726740 RepID=UPI001456B292|nr:cellobiose phosphorylase [Rhizobium sp. P38BS-XIX]NLR98456.1 cellobiose phosphorylase [Rhizobium sp. P38BS-XIX]